MIDKFKKRAIEIRKERLIRNFKRDLKDLKQEEIKLELLE